MVENHWWSESSEQITRIPKHELGGFFGGRGFPDPKPSFGVTSDKGRYSLASIMRNMAKCFEAPNWRQKKKTAKGFYPIPMWKLDVWPQVNSTNFPSFQWVFSYEKFTCPTGFPGTHYISSLDVPSRGGILVWFCDTVDSSGSPALGVILLMEEIRNPAPVEVGSLSHYLEGFKHAQVVQDSINSMETSGTCFMKSFVYDRRLVAFLPSTFHQQ